MGTEILGPQDYFAERVKVSPCRRRNFYYTNSAPKYHDSNPRFNRKSAVRSERTDHRKRQPEPPSVFKRSGSVYDFKVTRNQNQNHNNHNHGNKGNNNLVMERVTILRRGESLDSKIKSSETVKKDQTGFLVITGTDRLGPDPEMVPRQIGIVDLRSPVTRRWDMYAGSGFAVSPAPSSLPLPSFSKKKQVSIDDSATRDLRRLLRLDL